MIQSDPLRTTELLALLEEATTPLRHDVRNRLASLRNLAFFVRSKLARENSPGRDPRVDEFLLKMDAEVQAADEVIGVWSARVQGVRSPELCLVRVGASVRFAIECTRHPETIALELAPAADELLIEGDPEALAVAVRCLLENAREGADSGSVTVRVARESDDCIVTVTGAGVIADRSKCVECFESTKPGHLGLGLSMARRIAKRSGGELSIGLPRSGSEVSLRIPLSGAGSKRGASP